ncbi:DUF3606 domain-containing protein [Mucilaginibacter sp.]
MERKIKPSIADTRTIDIEDDYALDFWAGTFGVTPERLRAAINVAGDLAKDVKKELKK